MAALALPVLLLWQLLLASAYGPPESARLDDSLYGEDSVDLRWEDVASWRDLPAGVVWCGYQYINDDLSRRERSYVARVYRGGSLVPGKATFWGASAALPNSTFSNIVNFEVAVGNPHRMLWVPAANGNIPVGAPATGLTRDGQMLYSCRFHSERRLSMACGAVQRFGERCSAELDGALITSGVYEVLVTQWSPMGFIPSPTLPPVPLPAHMYHAAMVGVPMGRSAVVTDEPRDESHVTTDRQ